MAWRRIRQATREDHARLTTAAERFCQRHHIPLGLYSTLFTVDDWASRDKHLRRLWLGVVSRTMTPSFTEGIRDGWVGYESTEQRKLRRPRQASTGQAKRNQNTTRRALSVSTDILETMDRKGLVRAAKRHLSLAESDLSQYETPALRDHIREVCRERGIDVSTLRNGNGESPTTPAWKLVLPALGMHQLGADCYLTPVKYRDLHLLTVQEDVQRPLKKARVPAIAEYVQQSNGEEMPDGRRNIGVFPSIVVTVSDPANQSMFDGKTLFIGPEAVLSVNEGQHRVAGTLQAIAGGLDPERLDDEMPVLLYIALTTDEQRQVFSDINTHLVKPPKSLNLAYDQRDLTSRFIRELVDSSEPFSGKVAMLKTRIGVRDPETFTLASIASAVDQMFTDDITPDNYDERLSAAVSYWNGIGEAMRNVWANRTLIANNRNVLAAIGGLYGSRVDADRLAALDWAKDGGIDHIIREAGGTNAAVPALIARLTELVATDNPC